MGAGEVTVPSSASTQAKTFPECVVDPLRSACVQRDPVSVDCRPTKAWDSLILMHHQSLA